MTANIDNLKVGDKVFYQSTHYPSDTWENGMVKQIGRSKDSVFVVYNCNDDWDNYKNYTAALTSLRDLKPGWGGEIETFLEKYG